MLTGKENLRETMKKDGNPDRFVKQYEFLSVSAAYFSTFFQIESNVEGTLWRR